MMLKNVAAIAAALLMSLPALGCYETVGVTWHEAGVYKGPRDPLLNKLKTDDLQQRLQERIQAVQTDR